LKRKENEESGYTEEVTDLPENSLLNHSSTVGDKLYVMQLKPPKNRLVMAESLLKQIKRTLGVDTVVKEEEEVPSRRLTDSGDESPSSPTKIPLEDLPQKERLARVLQDTLADLATHPGHSFHVPKWDIKLEFLGCY